MLALLQPLRRFKRVDDLVTRLDPYKSAFDWATWGWAFVWPLVSGVGVFTWLGHGWKAVAEQGWPVVLLFAIACTCALMVSVTASLALWRYFRPKAAGLPTNPPERLSHTSPPVEGLTSETEIQQLKADLKEFRILSGLVQGTLKGSLDRFIPETEKRLVSVNARLDSHLVEENMRLLETYESDLDLIDVNGEVDWRKWSASYEGWTRTLLKINYLIRPYTKFDYFSIKISISDISRAKWDRDFTNFGSHDNELKWKEYRLRREKISEETDRTKARIQTAAESGELPKL